MKSIFGVLAFILAIGAAFAFKTEVVPTPGYVDGSNICRPATASCSGGLQDCRADIPEIPGSDNTLIFDYDLGCANTLKMP